MSTDYGLYCQDCKEKAFSGEYGETSWYLIQEFWQYRNELAGVQGLIRELNNLPGCDIEIRVTMNYIDASFNGLFEFLEKHKGHNILILDEYGYLRDVHYNELGKVDRTYE